MGRARGYLVQYFLILLCLSFYISLISQDYNRFVAGFSSEGNLITNPLVGGLHAPQFNTIDLNNDGIKDLVVFDRVGDAILPFLYTEDAPSGSYVFAPEYIDVFPDTKLWMLLRDYNNDGIEDVFKCPSVPGIPGIEVHKGRRDGDELSFELVPSSKGDFEILYAPIANGFVQLYVSLIDLPAIEDLDFDGDLDVLSFEPGGTKVTYYKNVAVEKGLSLDSLDFVIEDNCYGKFQESGFSPELTLSNDANQCASFINGPNIETRHAGSTITAFDEDANGLIDLVLGDISNSGLVLVYNNGESTAAWMTDQDINFPGYDIPVDIDVFNSAYYIDVDNDQKRDLVVASNERNIIQNKSHIWLYKNTSEQEIPVFELTNKSFLVEDMLYLGTNSSPTFTDYNQDGLIDLVVGTQGFRNVNNQFESRLYLFENIGTISQPSFSLVDSNYLDMLSFSGNSTNYAPAFGDLDGDGDQDLIVGDGVGFLFYFENIAGLSSEFNFADPVYEYQNIRVGQQVKPFIFDLNEDGLGDLIIGERNFNSVSGVNGSINYLQNIGTPGNPEFSGFADPVNSEIFGGIFTKDQGFINNYSAPHIVPVVGDFLLFTGTESGKIKLYDNVKGNLDGQFNLLSESVGAIQDGVRSTIAVADIDADNYFEVITGNLRGGLTWYNTDILVDENVSTSTEDSENGSVRVYPNPVENYLNIEIPSGRLEIQVIVFNLEGKRVISNKIVNKQRIDVASLPAGIYLIQLFHEEMITVTKFIKI